MTAGVPDSSGWSAEVRSRRVIVSEIAAALRIPERTSENLVAESSELVNGLPGTFQALAEGAISRRHASRLIDHARSLPDASLAAFEDAVLPHARRLTVAQFDRKARQVRERTHPESIDARQRDAFERRSVALEHGRDGLSVYVPVPAARAQAIFNRLTDMAETQRRHETELSASARTIDQLRADLFVRLLLEGQLIPEHGQDHADLSGIRATVLITVPALTLLSRRTRHP